MPCMANILSCCATLFPRLVSFGVPNVPRWSLLASMQVFLISILFFSCNSRWFNERLPPSPRRCPPVNSILHRLVHCLQSTRDPVRLAIHAHRSLTPALPRKTLAFIWHHPQVHDVVPTFFSHPLLQSSCSARKSRRCRKPPCVQS